jgi:hypothetical protein
VFPADFSSSWSVLGKAGAPASFHFLIAAEEAGYARRVIRLWLAVIMALSIGACATYREDLNRGQRLYEENEYEHALSIFRVLESDMDSLELNDQARYAYLRGMTDFRLGFRPDARHWLALAKAIEQEHPGGLSPQWKQRLDESLSELNQEVYGGGEAGGQKADAGGAAPAPERKACATNTDCPEGLQCKAGECAP